MTYSMLGRDSANNDLGVAVQSKFPGVGGLVPYGEAEVGVVATQAFGNPRHGSSGLMLLRCGATPQQSVDILLHGDDKIYSRQFALLDRDGDVAAYTGADLHTWEGWAGSAAGRDCVALGNGLASRDVVEQMVATFEESGTSLAERLMAALEAGERAGGDIRGQQSAALLVLRRNGGYGSLDDRHVVISIYDHPQPIAELKRCYALHRLSYFPSDPADLVPITPELALELKRIMSARGFYDGDVDDRWDPATHRRFELFLGSENYDNRIDNGGLLDLEVLADLRARNRHSPTPWRRAGPITTDDAVAPAPNSPWLGEVPAGSAVVRWRPDGVAVRGECEIAMCRWMAYSGDPILADDLLFRPKHSIIDQSLHAQLGGFTTNGDGFGIGWYGNGNATAPAVFKSAHPAWNDENLREVARQIHTPLLFAHVRASSGTAVQRNNCHPFRYGRWLWMHNGSLAGFQEVKRDLQMAVDASLYPEIQGSTDTETLFFLALTFGLADDPPAAVARAVGLVEQVGRRHEVEHPVHMTVATSDGESIWVFRYSSEKATSSLYYSTEVSQVRALHPELDILDRLGADTRFVVSEPLRDLPGAWNEVPEGSWGHIRRGEQEIQPFQPVAPA